MEQENKITRVFPDFQDELMKIDPRLTIVPNPNRPKVANVKLDGIDVCVIPAYEIRELPDPSYTLELPNGTVAKHRSKLETLAVVQHTLNTIKTSEGADAFFGRNGY